MDKNTVMKAVDHTLLGVASTWEEMKVILDDAMAYGTASACIPCSFWMWDSILMLELMSFISLE